jgi:hypothetical protein
MAEHFVVYLNGAGDELDRLAAGPGPRTIAEMEAALLEGFTITEGKVHVITGYLKASGHPSSHRDPGTWTGEIAYDRHPGIFELARGHSATGNHPEGGHYFFGDPPDGGGPHFERGVRQAFWDWVTDYKGGRAPSGGLPPESGGD